MEAEFGLGRGVEELKVGIGTDIGRLPSDGGAAIAVAFDVDGMGRGVECLDCGIRGYRDFDAHGLERLCGELLRVERVEVAGDAAVDLEEFSVGESDFLPR